MFSDFVQSVIPNLAHQYGPLIAFEHGANTEGSITACGTDHAHLHLVPLSESLLPKLNDSGLHWVKCKASQIASITGRNEYLFYSDLTFKDHWQDTTGYLHVLESPTSQFFRRLVADQKGKTDVSDYKIFPHLDVALQTRRMLASAFV
jgi:ATP adenylyltransferase